MPWDPLATKTGGPKNERCGADFERINFNQSTHEVYIWLINGSYIDNLWIIYDMVDIPSGDLT